MRFLFNPITSQFNAAPPREIIYSDTAPAFPVEGTRWVNTLEIREYVFTFDANGAGYWVEVGIGSTGPQGETGDVGPVGPVGPQGIQGVQGPAATVAVGTVSTGEPGTSVSVSNAGTSGAAVLDFTIPRGAVGQTGDVGPQGPQGIQGLKGDTGNAGPQGIQGVTGPIGPVGPQGPSGTSVVLKGSVAQVANLPTTGNTAGDLYVVTATGDGYVWSGSSWSNAGPIRGPVGPAGATGATGATGPQGPQGIQGVKGDTGAQGPAGPAPAGTGAVVVSNGVLGTPVGYGTANTANTLVRRDASGNFSAGTITANLTGNVTGSVTGGVSGNAGTATKLATARTINVSGDVTGTAQNFDGSANVIIPTQIAAGSIVNADINAAAAIADTKLATISTAGKVLNSATTATNANTANAIVSRDANGNFSANTVTANLSGNASTATKLATVRKINGTNFDGTADITVADSTRVLKTGDTMTGELIVSNTSPRIRLNETDAIPYWLLASGGNFYVTTDRDNSGAWETPHPLQLRASDGLARVFGDDIWHSGNFNPPKDWVSKTAAYTAVAGDRISANTTAAAFTITLPAAPAQFAEIVFADHYDRWATRNLTIARNGKNIEGLAENLVCDVAGSQITLRYEGTTWRVY
jgi:hypothetical protein